MNKHQVGVAAEAFAAAVFAQAGLSVFVQYGANQPGYDLIVTYERDDDPSFLKTIHVSVKGSSNGGWLLKAKQRGATLEQALDSWHQDNQRFIFCFVQFEDVEIGEMPRIYLATAEEVIKCLQTHNFGAMTGTLIEDWTRMSGRYKGQTQQIPKSWKISKDRIHEMFR